MGFAKQLAADLWRAKNAAHDSAPLALLFAGDLGAGKTHFIKQVVATWLGAENNIRVTSPTFSLINIYEKNGVKILHGDFYRLKNETEAEELNLFDYYRDHQAVIEWPEKIAGWWPRDYLRVTIEQAAGNRGESPINMLERRTITLAPQGVFYENFLQDGLRDKIYQAHEAKI